MDMKITFGYDLTEMKNKHYNDALADLVRNLSTKDRIMEFKGKIAANHRSGFNDPKIPKNLLDYRTHFFAPKKHF
jgi:hypothetical protein